MRSNGLMDYSLLLIKEKTAEESKYKVIDNSFDGGFFGNYPSMADAISVQDDDVNPWSRNILYSKDGSEIYHIGIIDYL